MISAYLLALIFAIIGIGSTIIGLGGGTFYLLFMQLFELPYLLIPIISLISNIAVSGLGAGIRLLKKERTSVVFMLVLLVPSSITSFLGALIKLGESQFKLILNTVILLIIILRTLLQQKIDTMQRNNSSLPVTRSWQFYIKYIIISACIGFASGIIGIGGGIILGPILYIYGMSYAQIPLITALYICINSLVSISVHLSKIESTTQLLPYIYLPIISVLSVLVTMKFIAYRLNSNQVRNITIIMLILIAIYNIIKLSF